MDLTKLQLEPHKLFHHLDRVISWQKGEYFPPIFVELSPTDKCNQKCWYCYVQYLGCKNLEIERDQLIKIFREMAQAGVKSVMIQGTGEPTLNKALPEAIIVGKDAGLSLALCTNGVLLNRKMLEIILPCLEWIRISDVECTPQLYATSHGSPELHWYQVVDNMKTAVAIRARKNLDVVMGTHLMLFPYNVESVVKTAELVKGIGFDYILIKSANQTNYNPQHNWERDTHKKFAHLLQQAKAMEDESFLVSVRTDQFEVQEECGSFKKNFERCYGIEFETLVDADGGVYPCLHFWRDSDYCYGNLYENTFEEIWKGERRHQVVDKIYNHFDLGDCDFGCKSQHINEALWELANPPMHVNFL